ncbi:MAG TPA: nuclear transport factor 2 family protein [Candidatus Acidoferrales bacterium]|nr:nuclear transport factor 2 family protein [Candidatus Acidoferrales bacterium]
MRHLLAISLVIGAACLAAWNGTPAIVSAAPAGEDVEAALRADSSLLNALKTNDSKALDSLLDAAFTWTDADGHTRTRAQFLREAATGAAGLAGYPDMKAQGYGQLVVISGAGKASGGADTFSARVWVKRPAGWRLLTHQDTAILAKAPAAPPAAPAKDAAAPVDCENPCRTLPVSPKTHAEKDVFKAYQDVETAVTSHDAKTWAYHVADEFVGIGRQYTGTPDTKAARVGQIGVVSNRVVLPKMLRGEAFVFGNAGIILADHQPVGEPPYHVIRVWVNRDGRWQLFHRQETTIR